MSARCDTFVAARFTLGFKCPAGDARYFSLLLLLEVTLRLILHCATSGSGPFNRELAIIGMMVSGNRKPNAPGRHGRAQNLCRRHAPVANPLRCVGLLTI